MQSTTPFRHVLILLAAFGLTAPALAALTIERSVTVTDEADGTLVMITSASNDEIGGQSTTIATFTDFQARSEGRVVSGEVMRSRLRTAEQLETVYDGTLEIATPTTAEAPERLDTLTFKSLSVVRHGDGPVLSGTVVYNEKVLDAAELPRPAKRLLTRTLRFFHFA
jgi:hypothetical protein